ncbi:unnamed protein product, partial [Ectocarpus fasciculatus]
ATAAGGFEASYMTTTPNLRPHRAPRGTEPLRERYRAAAAATTEGTAATNERARAPWRPLRPRCALRGTERPWERYTAAQPTAEGSVCSHLPMNTRDGLTSSCSAPVGAAGAASASSCPPRDRPVAGAVRSVNGRHVGRGRRSQ